MICLKIPVLPKRSSGQPSQRAASAPSCKVVSAIVSGIKTRPVMDASIKIGNIIFANLFMVLLYHTGAINATFLPDFVVWRAIDVKMGLPDNSSGREKPALLLCLHTFGGFAKINLSLNYFMD